MEIKKITEEGKKIMLEDIKKLKKELVKLVENKTSAYTLTGDTWHDNPYFNQLEREEEALVVKIHNMENFVKDAVVVEKTKNSMVSVEIGSIVKCECSYSGDDESDVEEEIYEIVGYGESDVDSGKLHYESPAAKSIMGLKVNDEATFETPAGEAKFKIIKFYENWERAEEDR